MGRLALLAGATLAAIAALALWHAFHSPAFVAGLGLAVLGLLGRALLGPGNGRFRRGDGGGAPDRSRDGAGRGGRGNPGHR